MSRETIQKVYPLTPMQEGMLYHSMLEPDSSFYFTQLELRLSGRLDMAILEKSVEQLLRSYDILRTVFVHEQLQRPRQVVVAERRAKVHFQNIAGMEPEQQQQYLEQYKRDNKAKRFDLAKDDLFRVAVFQLAEQSYHFIWNNHHILLDGWSLGVLMKRLFHNYETFRAGLTPPAEPERPYADYIKWLEKQDKDAALEYWEGRLEDYGQSAALPRWNKPEGLGTYRNEELTFVWDEELVASIKQAASRYQVTVPNLFQAVWGALLARYNNTGDVVFGTVVSGRPSAINGIESMVGLFINTIPVRVRTEGDTTFADLFTAVQQSALEAEKYDYVPLYEIQNRSSLQQHLINHLLAFENYPLDRELENGNFEQRLGFSVQVAGGFEQTNYDFNLIVFPGERWTIKMMYNGAVYDRERIEKVAGHLTRMTEAAVRDPKTQVGRASFLSEEETKQLLETCGGTDAAYPQDKTIHALFEEQAKRVPDHVAVVFGDRRLTYRELNAKSNRLAKALRGKGVGPDDIVGIMAERSVEMIVGMLAILKAGGAYLPIDPGYPPERIGYMLEDSGTRLLLKMSGVPQPADFAGETLDLNEAAAGEGDGDGDGKDLDAENLEPVGSPDDLSYIIYTSGTTGKPKGVMITHRNVVRLLVNDKLPFTFSERDAWTMFHSFCFDFSVWEMYGALLYGGKLVVVPKHVAQSPHEFRELLIKEQVTVLNQTPNAFLSLIQRELTESVKRLGIRYVVFGGEALQPLTLKDWHEKYPETKLINMYGITETTVHVTFKEIGEEEIHRNISNIGVPIPTLGCYIMDNNLNLVPVGVVGELCVSGLGVARGYLHRPELTAERFPGNPHKPGERLYRSGDLARFLPNGEMEYFGRIDHQVKIRGFRIELGEIEHQLLKIKPITAAAVLARTDRLGDQRLYAYVVAERQMAEGELRQALLVSLPDYMVPAHFIQLPKLPLTSNGKLDRGALPEPEAATSRAEYREPVSELERQLAEVWQEVLGVSRVGIDDDFFSLGGHSLKAMLLATKIHRQLQREMPIKALFERSTIRRLAEYLQEAAENRTAAIEPAPARPHYPVSSAQRRMYILSQLEGAGVSYNIPAALMLEGGVDKSRLEAAFQALIDRHETLRTSFEMVEGALVQTVHERVRFDLNCGEAPEEEAGNVIRRFIRPFELQRAPLVRAELIRLTGRRWLLLIDMHHIISDGSSTAIFVRELDQLYRGENLTAPKLHYKDFAVWQSSNALQQERMKRLESYWLDKFAGDIPVLELPTDYQRPSGPSFAGERFDFGIGEPLAQRIYRITEQTGSTLYMFLLTALNVFLAKYSSQEDIIVGCPVSGRTHADIADVPGMFVGTVALRAAPEGGKTFKQLLLEVKETCLQAFAHQDYPFEELVEKLVLPRDTSRSPLFNVMFNMQNMDASLLQLGSLTIVPYRSQLPIAAKFDLTLEAAEHDGTIGLSFDYATALYSQETIRRWSGHLLQIAESAAANPDILLADIEMLSPQERRQLLAACSDNGVIYAADQTIHSQFERQAAKSPDRVAVVDEEERLSYRELDVKANRLARELRERGVGREDAVALLLDRSVDTIVAIMAVLKAGGAYLPIDPEQPEQRIEFILGDSRARYLITQPKYAARVAEAYSGAIIDIRGVFPVTESCAERVEPVNEAGDLAYMIYTSGTTGQPKGVMIEHRQVLHLIEGLRGQVYSHYDYTTLHVALVAPFHFDASVQQIFAALLLGHTLFIVPSSSVFDGRALAAYYRTHRIDVTDGTPAHLQMLLAAGSLQGLSMRHMLIGGEALPLETVRGMLDMFAQSGTVPAITNVYGPTECCVDASAFDVAAAWTDADHGSPYVPIGTPLGNNRLYIVDAYGRLQPAGVPGELCIAGDGVGRGYLNLPQVTAEKFVPDPFVPGATMYRTGDLARRRADGVIEFIGRMDSQVKIRGYRVELGEIETALLGHERVTKAVVTAHSQRHGAHELCAYFTADTELAAAELREWLAAQLPKYMVPSYYVQLESIPLTSNGKIDRRALPAPDLARPAGTGYVPPASDTEKQLCLLWQQTLGVETVGIDDNFFDMGGHSLKAMMLTGGIQSKLQRDIPLKVLFDRPTIRQLAVYLESAAAHTASGHTGMAPAEERAYYPVSSAQKRMYILHQFDERGVSYNMPAALLLQGELDAGRLERALQSLVERHESLRTSFTEKDGTPVQIVHDRTELGLSLLQAAEAEAGQRIHEFIRPFDLSSAPLFRTGLIRLAEQRHLLLIDMHHIIADGASVDIFVKEIARLYAGEHLPKPHLHYKDYAMWQYGPVQQEAIRAQERYWLDQFADSVPILNLPADYPRPPVQSFAGDVIRFGAPQETALQVRRLAAQTGTTFHIVMLAVFNVFLSKMSGQEDIVVGSAASGRTSADVMAIPGMFVNTLALRSVPKYDKSFIQFLREVKMTCLQALEHQDYPFEELIGKLDLPRDMSQSPLFSVMLTVDNPDKEAFRLEGLSVSPYDTPNGISKFDLTLAALEREDEIGLQLEYATELFKRETVTRWSGYLLNIMRTIAANPDILLSDIELVTAEEKRLLLADWNRTAMEVPADKTIHQLFEAQVRSTPDRTAVTHNGRSWTYRELNARANRLARTLIDKGIGIEQRVGIMAKPSLEMAAGVLAIVKAGAAFVPIDPDYPEQRVAYILSDSGATVLLTQTELPVPAQFGGEVILMDRELAAAGGGTGWEDAPDPDAMAKAHHLAYMIYTSGTTGQPKGVMIEHRSLVNLCYWHNEAFAVSGRDRSAKYAGFGFDASVWELFPYWIAGADIHIVDESIRKDIVRLNEYFERHGITIAFLPTQLCEQFMELDNRSLRMLLTGGDKLKRAVKRRYTLVNNYGPTESTVVATSTVIEPDEGTLSIGRPVANTRVYIVGPGNQLQPVGVPGELCIAGRGLARGYNNRPEETAEKFVADPFAAGERMYRTGDLARRLEDGSIEYIGRIDQQVKVRGFRIELAEIEAHLAQHPSVKEAAVAAVRDAYGNTALCAYFVSSAELRAGQLQADLARKLPEYMVPQIWVQLDALPLTPNGKVDRRALPVPDTAAAAADYKEPSDGVEALLAGIWQQVLGVPRIGVRDNFFLLGGDSIKAIQMASMLHKHGWKLEMKMLFQNPTIERVSPYLQRLEGKQAQQGAVEGEVKLTPIQRWFFERRFTDMHHWNQSVMLHAPSGFDSRLIEQTVRKLAEHHDALRMVYTLEADNVVPYNRGLQHEAFSLEIVDLRADSDFASTIAAHAGKVQGSMDLSRGPLFKLAQYQAPDGDHLLMVIHHLAVDGVSWRILLEDFASAYVQAAEGEPVNLQDKTNSFQEWAAELETYANSEDFLKQAHYWRQIEAERISPLPKDNIARELKMKDSAALSFELSEQLTHLLLTQVHRPYGTEINDILLAALGLAVREWTNEPKVWVAMEGHGREQIVPGMNVSRTVGWFTSQYPVVLELDRPDDLPATIKTVKERLRSIPDKGVGYGIIRYLTADEGKSGPAFCLEPEISFNYLGQFGGEVHTEFFAPSPYDMGAQTSRDSEQLHALSFSGIVRSGRLVLSCSFNKQQYLRSTITKLMTRFNDHLLALIRHCADKKDRDFTPSDFSAKDLEMDEVGDIFEVLADKLG